VELTEAWDRSEKLRLSGFRCAMAAVAPKGRFRPGHDQNTAADVMFVMLSPLVYQECVDRLKWPVQRWSGWAADAVTRALFEDEASVAR
jgi:hypothetical protein